WHASAATGPCNDRRAASFRPELPDMAQVDRLMAPYGQARGKAGSRRPTAEDHLGGRLREYLPLELVNLLIGVGIAALHEIHLGSPGAVEQVRGQAARAVAHEGDVRACPELAHPLEILRRVDPRR